MCDGIALEGISLISRVPLPISKKTSAPPQALKNPWWTKITQCKIHTHVSKNSLANIKSPLDAQEFLLSQKTKISCA
jgi:hypothetical protein